jgi:DNA polymerase gamma 1
MEYIIDGKKYRTASKEIIAEYTSYRQAAKTSNLAILYGSGVKSASGSWFKLFPEMPPEKILSKVKNALNLSKGIRNKETNKFEGGLWSGAFNYCEKVGVNPLVPTLPCLGTRISTALRKKAVNDDFYTSKLNWSIQASGAEFLALFLTALHWLCDIKHIPFQFVISIHDEVWCMVPEEFVTDFVIQFQIAHMMTWARFQAAVGINELSLTRAFFSTVAIDDRIRKSVNENTNTPSNSKIEPDGVELNISEILAQKENERTSNRLF